MCTGYERKERGKERANKEQSYEQHTDNWRKMEEWVWKYVELAVKRCRCGSTGLGKGIGKVGDWGSDKWGKWVQVLPASQLMGKCEFYWRMHRTRNCIWMHRVLIQTFMSTLIWPCHDQSIIATKLYFKCIYWSSNANGDQLLAPQPTIQLNYECMNVFIDRRLLRWKRKERGK